MVLPITQKPVYYDPNGPGYSPFAMAPSSMPYPHPGTTQSKGGILQNLISVVLPGASDGSEANVDSIMGKLEQLQRVLGVVQKSAPIIQQYGPMVKQLPTMLQMIKALNDADTEEESVDVDDTQDQYDDHSSNEDVLMNDNEKTKLNAENEPEETLEPEEKMPLNQHSSGQSIPKLFI